jgi:hypothetical protein
MPFCAARALHDNGAGKVLFIDPSYSGSGHPGWGGGGLWSDPDVVAERIESHGLTGWIEHLRMTSEEAFPCVRDLVGSPGPGVVIIDGAHTHEQSLRDFDLYSSLLSQGYVAFHDSTNADTEVPRTIRDLRDRGLPAITLHCDVGLTIVEIAPRRSVEESWSYLCNPSDRITKIGEVAAKLVRPGDRILDSYCGWSPLAAGLSDVRIFGFDSDPMIIRRLREQYAAHTWKVIDEYRLPFADLPDEIDVLAGLGVTYGYAWWDPQQVLNNTRYLVGRYHPRACLFEAATDYHDALILKDIKALLVQWGYSCHYEWFEADLASFSRRKVLVAATEE